MKVLRNFSRLFVGLVFIYSGFVKVIDPLGSAYKFTDYFVAMHLDFLSGMSLFFAILLSVAELVIGIALVFNLVPKLASWGVLLFMGLFTPLTLWLAAANPVSDCGCFGDALILTNWQTFYKNLVLLAFVIVIFIYRKRFKPAYNEFFQWSLGIFFAIASIVLSLYCLRNLPIIDFRPYHIGANIQEGMMVPDEEKDNIDVYESVFIYEKNGEKKEFAVNNLPDSTWTFVDASHKLIKEGYKPPIHDFTVEPIFIPGISPEPAEEVYVNLYDAQFMYSKDGETEYCTVDDLPDNTWKLEHIVYDIELDPSLIRLTYLSPEGIEVVLNLYEIPGDDYVFIDAEYIPEQDYSTIPYGEDITDVVLTDENYAFFLVMTNVEKAKIKHIAKINEIAEFCEKENYNFYCLTASGVDEITSFVKENNVKFNFYNTDPITLKTVVRSNPGLVLVKKGTILNKWSGINVPDVKELQRELTAYSITEHQNNKNNLITLIYILSLCLFMSMFHNLYVFLVKKKFINVN
ncbi:MAG TPA: DoxX family protein [Bacteroidales bacterium]|nr:DoxX family protein [Bacteroidales bacterium]